MVPVSTAIENDDRSFGNSVSGMFVALPVHHEDPVEQLREIRIDAATSKRMHKVIGSGTLHKAADVSALISKIRRAARPSA